MNIEKVENSLVILQGSMVDPNFKRHTLNGVVILTLKRTHTVTPYRKRGEKPYEK